MKRIFFLIIFFSSKIVLQSQTCTAVPVITLNTAGVPGIATQVMVAYNPINNIYYWNTGGFGSNPIATHASSGGGTVAVAWGNQDWRGLWWNSNTNTLEGNCYNSAGIFTVALNQVNGYVSGGSTIVSANQQPNPQVGGQYDPTTNQVLYYNGAFGIAKYSRATGLPAGTTNITGLPGGIGSIATYGFYTGIAGLEYAIYDYTNRRAYCINYNTGAYVSTVQFPPTAGAPSAYSLSYANGLFFIYDNSNWIGYRAGVWANHTAPICVGGTATLTAQGSPSYSWSNGSNTYSTVVTPSANSTYTVSGTPGVGCQSEFIISVNINPALNPTVSVTGNTLICGTGTNVLVASGADTYSWNTGSTTPSVSLSPVVTSTYVVVGTSSTGCTNSKTASITVSSNPSVSITGSLAICNGQSTSLTASGASSYSWSNGSVTSVVGLNPGVTTSYTVTGTNSVGCTSTSVETITVYPSPTLAISGGTAICQGAAINLTVSGADTYSWNTGATTNTITASPTVNTTYSVTGTSTVNGCPSQSFQLITINPTPTISVAGTNTICPGQSATLIASGANSYAWSTGAGTASVSVSPAINTTYTVTATSAQGCTTIATVNVYTTICTGMNSLSFLNEGLIEIYPNPNNGLLNIRLLKFSDDAKVSVYNVLGVLVKEQQISTEKTMIDLQDQPTGIYLVKISEKNKVIYTGKVVRD